MHNYEFIVHRSLSNKTFQFKCAPICKYGLLVYSQHAKNSCIHSTSYYQNQRGAMCHRHCNGVRYHMRHFILHRTPRNIIFKFNHVPIILTYFLLIQRQHDTDPYNTKINAARCMCHRHCSGNEKVPHTSANTNQ